jgi:hypothetical protein
MFEFGRLSLSQVGKGLLKDENAKGREFTLAGSGERNTI